MEEVSCIHGEHWDVDGIEDLAMEIKQTYAKSKLVDAMVGKMPQQVACGGYHSVVRTEDGKVFSFGRGWSGQLGHDHHNTILTP